MGNGKLKMYMMSFSREELLGFLGKDLLDSVMELHIHSLDSLNKTDITKMILNLHGINILSNQEFRNKLYHTLPIDFILDQAKLLGINENVSVQEIVDKISKIKWGDNNINYSLLRYLDYSPDDIFVKKSDLNNSSEVVKSFDKFYELLDYQYVIRQKSLNFLNSNLDLGRFLIHMPTGTGKTKTAVHIMCNYHSFTLKKEGIIIWIAHTNELLEQALNTFVSVWRHIGDGDINVHRLWGDNNLDNISPNINGIIFCGVQKLQSIAKNNEELFDILINQTRLIVYDEAHKAAADETRKIINSIMVKKDGMQNRFLMGLTATPGRTTEISFDNDLLSSMFENRIIGIETDVINSMNFDKDAALNASNEPDIIKYFQNRGVLAKIIKEELTYPNELGENELRQIEIELKKSGFSDYSKKSLELIGRNKYRNRKIIERLIKLNNDRIPTIVFACSVNHGRLISSMLSLENIPNALVIGEMSKMERNNAILEFKNKNNEMNILINYEVLTTGFDATNIECVFIARPTKSIVLYSQMIGRGLRGPQMGGKEHCLLVDIKDNLENYSENDIFSHFDSYWNN